VREVEVRGRRADGEKRKLKKRVYLREFTSGTL